jgi:hypothetical protein
MSFTASRFQPRFGYGPALRVGNYPGATQGELPAALGEPAQAAAAETAAPAAAPTAAPVAADAPPVSAGSVDVGGSVDGGGSRGDDISSDRDGNVFGLGPNPGNLGALGAGLSGFGTTGMGGALGGLGGMMLGGPLGGLLGMALGSLAQPALSGTLFNSEVVSSDRGSLPSDLEGDLAAMNRDEVSNEPMAAVDMGMDEGSGLPSDLAGDLAAMNNDDFSSDPMAPIDPGSGADYGGAPSDSPDGEGDGGEGGGAWMSGGYTGPGHPAQPAGTVHRGEVVIPAEMVARYGLRPLMALVEGSVPPSRLAALARP